MIVDFKKHAFEGDLFLRRLESYLGNEDAMHAERILKCTFKAMRNHFRPEESLKMISALPVMIKGMYVDGWSFDNHHRLQSADQFISEVVDEDGEAAWRDFGSQEEILLAINAVFKTLEFYVSSHELDKALGTFAGKLRGRIETVA